MVLLLSRYDVPCWVMLEFALGSSSPAKSGFFLQGVVPTAKKPGSSKAGAVGSYTCLQETGHPMLLLPCPPFSSGPQGNPERKCLLPYRTLSSPHLASDRPDGCALR